ncbi:MAG: FAD-dependent oxidoreductase [Bacteroidetes bacterium]|nr:FAD-dependent oxidoreductase [Bacteroidota bacterium]
MTDKFTLPSLKQLLHIIFHKKEQGELLGIPKEIFFQPEDTRYQSVRFNQLLDIPLGVAAGPHSQLAQNIVGAWLCGARYIELKTIQTLDELNVSKPCIDAADEGYNCEWSQELKINESYDQYLNAWIIIHLLQHKFGWKNNGCIFNMSAGYNLEGLLNENVQWFFSKMQNCSIEKAEKIKSILSVYPWANEVEIPDCISDNITLSTMHGCPPDEIEKIGLYLIQDKKFHTTIKLNPTLLGKEELRKILNIESGFKITVPDEAFEHDLKYPDAINIIKRLRTEAANMKVDFSLKLSNTLEAINIRGVLPENESMNYMSGRALHPISVKLAARLQHDFGGKLDISFSAGADCYNFPELIACRLKPVTVCTDLLKPGGYMRLRQYADELGSTFDNYNAINIEDFILKFNNNKTDIIEKAALENLNRYANRLSAMPEYKKTDLKEHSIKTNRKLGYFDCIAAPCIDTCPTNQNIPDYMYHTSHQNPDAAFNEILKTNPFPTVTGFICDHPCQTKCTRINYDSSLKIREIKRFVAENAKYAEVKKQNTSGIKVAVIGAGPSGLSCAYYLALAGFKVSVYEEKEKAGGMVQSVIPAFRLKDEAIETDVNRIQQIGVQIFYNQKVDKDFFNLLCKENEFIYIATGAQLSKKIDFAPATIVNGLLDPLVFLYLAKTGQPTGIGKHIAIIGGGNTAMDTARTAWRLTGNDGSVTIIYRRNISEMPADTGEIKAVIEEGIKILELTQPESLIIENGNLKGINCSPMQLKSKGSDGRIQVENIENAAFKLDFDTIIPAIGQDLAVDFINSSMLKAVPGEYKTRIPGIYIGGDALRGAATAINAIGDGRKTAEAIIRAAKINQKKIDTSAGKDISYHELMIKKGKRIKTEPTHEKPVELRRNFEAVDFPLTEKEAITEASRCLYCDEVCNICVTVCPNFANYAYQVKPQQIHLLKAIAGEHGIILKEDKLFEVKQQVQIINIADFCNECGNCQTFCPTSGAPYKDKPHFYLNIGSFKDAESGYFYNRLNDRKVLIFKEKENIKTLTLQNNLYIYETDQLTAEISSDNFTVKSVILKAACVKEAYFDFAAEMYVLMKGVEGVMSYEL